MTETGDGVDVFEYDDAMPSDHNIAKYYYTVRCHVDNNGVMSECTPQSLLYKLELMNHYVIRMQSKRGPCGSKIPVAGRGFSVDDKIMVESKIAPTIYTSSIQLAFIVPALAAAQSCPVEIIS